MRRGCIAVGMLKCDVCKSTIEHGERYLLIDDEKGAKGKKYVCVDCCLKKKMAKQIVEKGEKIVTFLVD